MYVEYVEQSVGLVTLRHDGLGEAPEAIVFSPLRLEPDIVKLLPGHATVQHLDVDPENAGDLLWTGGIQPKMREKGSNLL
jgi:hypothetical protein